MLAVIPAEQVVVVFFVNDPELILESYVRDLISAGEAGRRRLGPRVRRNRATQQPDPRQGRASSP